MQQRRILNLVDQNLNAIAIPKPNPNPSWYPNPKIRIPAVFAVIAVVFGAQAI